MKYYLISGEASGDLHASNLVKALHKEDPQADVRAWGGDLTAAAGATLVKHYRDLAFMGFLEVVKHLGTILNNIKWCKQDIEAFQPDVLILVDYPGFNLRIARWAHQQGIKVFYYISPQLWAWHSSRVHQIRKTVDRMYVILPFEKEFYAGYQVEVDFVGHPLLDVIDNRPRNEQFRTEEALGSRPLIALLPGSRRQEIQRMLGVMLQTVADFPNYRFVIAGAPSIEKDFYREIIARSLRAEDAAQLSIVQNRTYDLLQHAEAALVTSGTATLETGLFGVPQVVCYSGSPLSYWIARRLVNVKYISLVNLIVDRPLVKELIQDQLNPSNLKLALQELLDPAQREKYQAGYQELRIRLGEAGASARAAKLMVERLKSKL